MEKNIAGIYIKVPCEHNVGSCTYGVCSNKTEIYPRMFENFGASKGCPAIPPATYAVSNLEMEISKSIPSIAEGSFRITIDFVSNYAGHLACLQLGVNLKDKTPS